MGESSRETQKTLSRPWQFSIAAMLGAMTVAGLCAAIVVWLTPEQDTYPASGKVMLKDGTPIQNGKIEFVTPDLTMSAIGQIEKSRFILSTYGHNDGCPPGIYKVVVVGNTPPIDEDYMWVETTPLEVEVKRKVNEFVIKLEPAK